MSFHHNFNKTLLVCLICCSFGFSQTQNVQNDINKSLKKLPFCEKNILSEDKNRLILVSTLDGKISALNIDNGGSETWNIQTGPGAMLSSSIHTLELTNDGKWVRMIPSLSGGLYKFNGDHIEAIPITAENLLRSSFKFSNDLVMSGGKESRVYGIEAGTGRVLYECSISGCDNRTELEAMGDVVVLRRYTQTVRAIEPLTGIERWNFSVGQHEVKMEAGLHAGCHSHHTTHFSDVQLKVIVPEGLVCAVSTSQPGRVLWSRKFESPVVSVWKLSGNAVEEVDLFGGIHRPPLGPDEQPIPSSPTLYVGMHQKQLYIQESVMMQRKLDELANSLNHHLLADERRYPQIPWNPVPVTGAVLGLPSPDDVLTAESTHEDTNQTTALSVLYASEYVNGNGYYLYSDEKPLKEGISLCAANKTKDNSTDEEIPVIESPDGGDQIIVPQIFVTSLWFWWKEVFLISVTTAVLLNILIQRRLGHGTQFPTSQIVLMKQTLKSYSSRDSGHDSTATSDSTTSLRTADNYESRFLTDFQPELCLGKGGFGVVFEARNKIDDCHYAIKRIPLPNSEESRERVMREVKALAKLDHQNIVRYFNAWLECPPPGWQETQDQLWLNTRQAVSSNGEAFTVDLTGQVTPDSERSCGHVINRNHLKPLSVWKQPDWLSQSTSLPSKPHSVDDDDSFIVFGSPSREASEAVTENLEEIEVKDDVKLDSAITVASDTSVDTNTDVSELERTSSQKRPNSLKLNELSTRTAAFSSSTMFLFIQMQLCKKESLKDWLKDNIVNRSRPDIINIFGQIVHAVEYVHMQGLIHRDLKPSNIFFSPDGQVKVGDFGLVTAMAESPVDSQSTWVGAATGLDEWADERHTARVGTQLYMSPEQVSGKSYSYKVDIYSLGVILFELLVSFNTQMERILALTNLRANKYPDQFQSQFPQEYELLKCMLSHRPEERPTTFGIRARPPLNHDTARSLALSEWHLELPSRRRSSASFSHSSSHSGSLDS